LNRVTIALRQTAIFCDRWQWVLLALASPFLLFPSPSRSLALFVVPGLWIVAWLAGREPLPRTPLNATLLLMYLMVLVSTLVTFDIAFSLPKIAGLVLGIGVFFAFVRYGKTARGWWLSLITFVGVGSGIAAFALVGTKWAAKFSILTPLTSRLAPRITGLPGVEEGLHPNQVAGGLVWVLLLIVVLLGTTIIRRREWLAALGQRRGVTMAFVLAVSTLLITSTFLLTQSRSGYIGFVIASIVILLIVLPSRWRWAFFGSIVVTIVLAAFFLWPSRPAILLGSAFGSNPAGEAGLSLDTLEGRMELWSRAIYGIQDFPFTGMGLNTFRRVVHMLYPLFLIGPDVDIGHAHNEYLQAALDLGIPGLIAFLALYIGAFWMLLAVWKATRDSAGTWSSPAGSGFLTKALVLGLGGGLLAHMVFSLTDATALGAKPGILFWMLLGLICGLFAQRRPRLSDQGASVERTAGISA